MNNVSNVANLNFKGSIDAPEAKNDIATEAAKVNLGQEPDMTEFSTKKEYNGPKIGVLRLCFNRLTDEQIKAVNETGRLPEKAKFAKIENTFILQNNFFNITRGTRTLPAGYELKKGFLGFTAIVPKDTQGIFLKDVK